MRQTRGILFIFNQLFIAPSVWLFLSALPVKVIKRLAGVLLVGARRY